MRNKRFIKHTSKAFAILMSAMMAVGIAMPVSAAEKKETKVDKSETVYVNANADGSVDKITVSDWLKNHGSSDALEDFSNLTNIKNVKGDETFTQNADGSIVWDSKGNDIYYQGETNEELPVTMKVSYYLDGEKMDPKDMAGKSGEVKIRFDYYNNSNETVKVKGKKYNIKTPFTMVTGMILSSDVFSNIEVKNGKVISDGDKSVVVGLAFPGLKSSLNLASYDKLEDVDIPDYVEVTAKADKFELALTATAATTGTLKNIDTSDLNDVDDLKENMDKLTDATDKLIDGSEALSEGMGTLSSSAGEYTKGVSTANAGVKQLVSGLNTLNSKSSQLESGVESLNEGLKALKKGTKALNSGISSYTKGVSSLDAGLQSAAGGTDKLQQGAGALSKGITGYTEGANDLANGIAKLNGKVSGMSNLKLPSEEELKAKAMKLLAIFNLDGEADTLAKNLAYGQQRHLEIVRALATEPKILFLDEPAAGMNPQETAELTAHIRQIQKDFGITIILIEHDMSLVMDVTERIYVLEYGRLIAEGTPDEIKNNKRVIEAYLGGEA